MMIRNFIARPQRRAPAAVTHSPVGCSAGAALTLVAIATKMAFVRLAGHQRFAGPIWEIDNCRGGHWESQVLERSVPGQRSLSFSFARVSFMVGGRIDGQRGFSK